MTFFQIRQRNTRTVPQGGMTVLGDADLLHVSGGFCGFYIKGPATPTKTTGNGGGGGLKLDGVAGESANSSHEIWIDL